MALSRKGADVNFEFFEKLSINDARSFLDTFLENEAAAFQNVTKFINNASGAEVFSLESIPPALQIIVNSLRTYPINYGNGLPEWIAGLPSHSENLVEFDEHSKGLVLLGGYYLGESFVRSFPELSWQIGHPETALRNMPVVSGFRMPLEMAPILVLENLSLGILVDNDDLSIIDSTVAEWTSMVAP